MSILAWIDSDFSLRFTQACLHCVWQGSLIAALAVACGRLLRAASAGWRYPVYVAALLLLAICIPVNYVMLDASGWRSTLGSHQRLGHTIASLSPDDATRLAPTSVVERGARFEVHESDRSATCASVLRSPDNIWDSLQRIIILIRTWTANRAPLITSAYFSCLFLLWLRLAIGVWGSHRIRRRAEPIQDVALTAAFEHQVRRAGLRVMPMLAWCRSISVPVVMGIVKPMILLPFEAASGLSPDQLQALVAHELAHIRRFDMAVLLLQRFIESVLFFHPAVWLISRRIDWERENAADDIVLSYWWPRLLYADALLRMAEISARASSGSTVLEGAVGAAGRQPSHIQQRVRRILQAETTVRIRLTRGAFLGLAFLATSIMAAILAPHRVVSAIDRDVAAAEGQGANEATMLDNREALADSIASAGGWQSPAPFPYQSSEIVWLDFSPDGRRLAIAGGWNSFQIWQRSGEVSLSEPAWQPGEKMTIHDVLAKEITFSVSDQPLIFVLDQLEKANHLPITIDLKALKDRGISPHMKVSLDVQHTPLREVLQAVLSPAGLQFEEQQTGIFIPAQPHATSVAPTAELSARVDIPGADPEVKLLLEPLDKDSSRQAQTFTVPNPGTLEPRDIAPGKYRISRVKDVTIVQVGEQKITRAMSLDSQDLELKQGDWKSVQITRPEGQRIFGRVVNGADVNVDQIVVYVCSANAQGPSALARRDVTVYDAQSCKADGTFETAALIPGRYVLLAEGYAPLPAEALHMSGMIAPNSAGTTVFSIPETGRPEAVEIRLKPHQLHD